MNDRAVPMRPRRDTAVLVCKACGKRAKAPKDAKPKDLAAALRRLAKGGARRPRIVLTGCLGLCPKRATAVAVVGGDAGARIVAIGARSELSAFEVLIAGPSPPPSDAAAVVDGALPVRARPSGPPGDGGR